MAGRCWGGKGRLITIETEPCTWILEDKTQQKQNYMQKWKQTIQGKWTWPWGHQVRWPHDQSSVHINTSPDRFVLPGARGFFLCILIKQNIQSGAEIKKRLQSQQTWIQTPVLAYILAVWSWGGYLASLSLFSHLWKVDNNIYFVGLLGALEVTYKKCLHCLGK